jgi:hypothetical protein
MLLLDMGGLSRIAGVTTTSVKCLQVHANVHVMFKSPVASTTKSALHVVAVLLSLGLGTLSAVVTLAELLSPCKRSFWRLGSGAFDSLEDGLLKVHPTAARTSCRHRTPDFRPRNGAGRVMNAGFGGCRVCDLG